MSDRELVVLGDGLLLAVSLPQQHRELPERQRVQRSLHLRGTPGCAVGERSAQMEEREFP